ncbi:hypothetical protein ACOMHN_025222 [Nucella lapillus]
MAFLDSFLLDESQASTGSLFVSDIEESLGIGTGDSYLTSNGRLVSRSDPLEHGHKYYVFLRVLGGKGGFGSMLRAIGAQIEKTTSREACRDLSGRRIRDVNNEKKLKDWWVTQQAERDREREEREERRRAKRAKYLEEKVPKMNDPEYDAQYSEIMRRSEQATQEGLARLKEGKSSSRKRKVDTSTCGALDKYDRWNMLGGLTLADVDGDSGSDSAEGSSSSGPDASALPGDLTPSSSSPPSSSSSRGGAASSQVTAPSATITSGADSGAQRFDPPPAKVARLAWSSSGGAGPRCSREEPGQTASALSEAEPERTGAVQTSQASHSQASHSQASLSQTSPSQASHSQTSHSQASPSTGAVAQSVQSAEPVDLDQYRSPEDLQVLGMERLKMELMRRGLKCGGSLEERAQRLLCVRGLAPEDFPAKLLAKGKGQGKASRR